MLIISPGYADDILTILVSGRVSHQDIESQLIPAIEAKLQDHSCIRLWYEFSPEFVGVSVGALWDDAWLSLFHLSDFSRVVMIADTTTMGTMVNALALILPCPVKVFSASERNQAQIWLDHIEVAEV